ncbi:hypothetical protein DYB32_009241, partial [Aphanomyces invadans]
MASDGGDRLVEQHGVFQTRRLLQVIELPLENSDETNVVKSFASRCTAKKQFQAFYCADKTLLLRSLEEDLHPRFWRLPWTAALERLQIQQQHQSSSLLKLPVDSGATSPSAASTQQVVCLEFDPEGDWLVVIVSWGLRTFLLLMPVASLVTRQRKISLQNHLRDGASDDLMSVVPSAMSTKVCPMTSFLRAHGQNGAKYHSNVAGDDEDVSVLEFAQGMSSPTCVAWWRSFNGQNYVLLGSSADLISIVHVESNSECCRCELSGKIDRIALVHTPSTTAMIVTTSKDDGSTWYFKVLLDMHTPTGVKTFPDHFLQNAAFRPVRIKQFASTASVHVVRDADGATAASTPLLAVCDRGTIRFYSNDFQWTLVTAMTLPTDALGTTTTQLDVTFCSSQLMLVQVARDSYNQAVWIAQRRPHRPQTDGGSPDAGTHSEDVADTICADHKSKKMSRNSCEWVMRLCAKSSHVMPAKTLDNMLHHGGLANAIEYAKEALASKAARSADRRFLAHTVIESALKLHHQTTPLRDDTKDYAWFVSFLTTNQDFDTSFAISRCVFFQCVDAALAIGHARRDIDAALRILQDVGASLTEAQ